LIGPDWRDLDLSLGKTFLLIEGIRLEIRADSFNALNHPNFAQPGTGTGTCITSPSAAGGACPSVTPPLQITGASGARSIQLGGRFTF